MEKELILKEIISQNKHWKKDDSFFEDKKFKRKLFGELIRYLPERQILSIVGLRRTGKTILLKQLIKHLLENKNVQAEKILFLSFDEALITSKLTLQNYLDVYFENILKDRKNKIYVFFDEIQYISKWQHILKRYYDRETNIKFIVSGSSSLFLKKRSLESLAGRIYEFKLNHLSFEEFLELSGVEKHLLDEFKNYAVRAGEKNMPHSQNEYNFFLANYGKQLELLFVDYLLFYQFPEMIGQKDKEKIKKYLLESIYKKTIEYDIPRLFGVAKVDELKFVYQMFIHEIGELVEFKNISGEAGIEENTLKKYIYYFQESFLLDLVYNYSKSFRKSKRLQKKSYIATTNLFAAFHSEYFKHPAITNQYLGKLVEAYIFNILKEKYQYISFYKKGHKEIDFVCNNALLEKTTVSLIEVKYVNTIEKENFSFLYKTAKDIFKVPCCFIYTKNYCRFSDDKIMLPCFLIK